jgi:hypothetical protein
MSETTTVRRLNIKGVGADPKEAIKQEKTVFMARLVGEANDVKHKEQKDGNISACFIGQFRATNEKGKNFDSEQLYLPKFMSEKIEADLKANPNGVQFAYDVFAMPDAKSSTGYVYTATSLIKSAGVDRLNELAGKIDKPLPGTVAGAAVDEKKTRKAS